MFRRLMAIAILAVFASGVEAALHTFTCTGVTGVNEITVITDTFELDTLPRPNGFQYDAVTPMQIQVMDNVGPVDLALEYVATRNDKITMAFVDADGHLLRMTFDVPGVMEGDPVPGFWEDADGKASWNLPEHFSPSNPTQTLAGFKGATVAVPEPSAFIFGGIAIGLVGVGRLIRRRFKKG